MTKTGKHKIGVVGVISLARKIESEIGLYQGHYINEHFGFTVRLSNGLIKMSSEIAHDYETQQSSVTVDRLEKVARTFKKL